MDVASAANVSQATVSRAFAGGKVSAEVRERVHAAARKLNYHPNAVARSLTMGRSHLIALIVSDQTSLFYPELVYAITDQVAERGYGVLLFTTSADRSEAQIVDEIWAHRVDGVLSMALLSPERCADFARHRLPVVLYNQVGSAVSSVYCDHVDVGRRLAHQIRPLGWRDIVVLAGPESSFVSTQFLTGFRAELEFAEIALTVIHGPYRYEFGHEETARQLDLVGRPLAAIICVNDTVAAGCLDQLRLVRGMSVPQDIAVVALNGRGPSMWNAYAITSMRQPTEQMAKAAVDLLLANIADHDRAPEHRVFFSNFFAGKTAEMGSD